MTTAQLADALARAAERAIDGTANDLENLRDALAAYRANPPVQCGDGGATPTADSENHIERFKRICASFHAGQHVVTSWGCGTVESIDPDWLQGGVYVRHARGTPKFAPWNVRPAPNAATPSAASST